MSDTRIIDRGSLPLMPDFGDFYRAINDRDPFPWQVRLAAQVVATEKWPDVGVQTGLGKTACLDIAVWWLASQADRAPERRTAPIRIWWVVNRRLLVDSTAGHAETIRTALAEPLTSGLEGSSKKVVSAVADRLRSMSASSDAEAIEVIRLRGGASSGLPTDPSQPAVILSTLPMYGSRLLFRGYGSSAKRRPIDASMAGMDSLVLLDEAHLAPHLEPLILALEDCTPDAQKILGRVRSTPSIAALTATGRQSRLRLEIDVDDEAHPIVVNRLDATKPTEIRVTRGDVGKRLAEATRDLVQQAPAPAAVVVFANTPATARATFSRLQRTIREKSAEFVLLTGLIREREAEYVRERVLDSISGMPSNRRSDANRDRHLIVVATQTLEVGADLDAEYLVTEACGVRALTQRLGRLNRLGRHPHARAIYVHTPPPPKGGKKGGSEQNTWPIYGSEPATVLQRLNDALETAAGDTVDLSPRHIAETLGPPCDDVGRAPEVLQGLLWEWVKTTIRPRGEAPVEPYFAGIAGPSYRVSLIWRTYIPKDGEFLWPRFRDDEAIDVPIVEVRKVFEQGEELSRLSSDGVTIEKTQLDDLHPGDQIVVRSDRGLIDEFGWNPSATFPVVDASLARSGLPLDAEAIHHLCGASVSNLIDRALGVAEDSEDFLAVERAEAIHEILGTLGRVTASGWDATEWNGLLSSLRKEVVIPHNEVPRLLSASARSEPRNDDLDETSLAAAAVRLDLHGRAVAARARRVADQLGIEPHLAETVECAGRLHDLGKAERRFQFWLDPDQASSVLVAKSNMPRHLWTQMRIAAGWPRGGRHEALSARLICRWLDRFPDWGDPWTRDLLLHLVLSHHGKARPLVAPVVDGTVGDVTADIDGTAIHAKADLSMVDWNQPARFRRLNDYYGPWGLALLEAILIRADHAVSSGSDLDPREVS